MATKNKLTMMNAPTKKANYVQFSVDMIYISASEMEKKRSCCSAE